MGLTRSESAQDFSTLAGEVNLGLTRFPSFISQPAHPPSVPPVSSPFQATSDQGRATQHGRGSTPLRAFSFNCPTRYFLGGARRRPTDSKEVNRDLVGWTKVPIRIDGNSPQPPQNSFCNDSYRFQAFPPLGLYRGTAGALGTLKPSPFRSPSLIQKVLT